jgi:hypothetical protein
MSRTKKSKNERPFWEYLNPITMLPPVRDSYDEDETEKYYTGTYSEE